MHRCFNKAARAFMRPALSFLLAAFIAGASGPDYVEQAKARLAKSDPKGAAALLEAAIPKTKAADRAPIVKLLRVAYQAAAKQSQAAGRNDEAQEYLDNLEILNRSTAASKSKIANTPLPAPAAQAPEPEVLKSNPDVAPVSPKEEPKAVKSKDGDARRAKAEINLDEPPPDAAGAPDFVPPQADPGAIAPPSAPREQPAPGLMIEEETPSSAKSDESIKIPVEPKPVPTPAPATKGPSVKEADEAFVGKRYDEANSIYSALNQGKALPADRRDHWAYCRAVEVVRRINTKPSTAKEWADIDAEIEQIRRLSPKNWFAEYLRNRAAERNPKLKTSENVKKAGALVVRGSSPEEDAPPAAPARAAATPAKPNTDNAPIETANFRVIHSNRALAESVAKAAEVAREAQVTRWTGQLAAEPWVPRCDIYLFSTAEHFSQETGQPKDSPGFSTMGMNAGKIVSRRINVRADHPNVLKAILPHEVTHVVLADLFPTQQIPRWADEGLSVLAEPVSEQAIRAAELEEPLSTGKLFKLQDLMVMDYPDAQYWGLYYAQSVSLTRFLVETGTPLQFVTFVKASQQIGMDSALKQVYKIQGDAELQKKWLAYAKSQSAKAIASNSDTVAEKEVTPERR